MEKINYLNYESDEFLFASTACVLFALSTTETYIPNVTKGTHKVYMPNYFDNIEWEGKIRRLPINLCGAN